MNEWMNQRANEPTEGMNDWMNEWKRFTIHKDDGEDS